MGNLERAKVTLIRLEKYVENPSTSRYENFLKSAANAGLAKTSAKLWAEIAHMTVLGNPDGNTMSTLLGTAPKELGQAINSARFLKWVASTDISVPKQEAIQGGAAGYGLSGSPLGGLVGAAVGAGSRLLPVDSLARDLARSMGVS